MTSSSASEFIVLLKALRLVAPDRGTMAGPSGVVTWQSFCRGSSSLESYEPVAATPPIAPLVRHRGKRRTQHMRLASPAAQPCGPGWGWQPGRTSWTLTVRAPFHRRRRLYYVIEARSSPRRYRHPRRGSIVQIPPGVVHSASGRVKVLVIGIPDIAEDDLYFP
jgi:hypothetical protein